MEPVFVVLTDFSAAAEAALTYTARLAAQQHGRVVLLHVYEDPLLEPQAVMATLSAVMASRQELLADLLQQAKQLPVPAEAELSVEAMSTALADVVARHHPQLLVLGRAAHDEFLDNLLRHQAPAILRAAHYPLLLVPEAWTDTALPSRLVVATDEQPFQLTASSLALADLLAALHPTTTVVHVAPQSGPSGAAAGLAAVQRTGLFGPLGGNDLYEVCEEAPADGVLHAAAELHAQLLVVLARPRTLLGDMFHRSVTAQLLRRSPRPVLVLPTT